MAPVLDAYKDIVGYWGPVDALHTFCEPKYVTHPKAAEFYNSIGSLIYCVAALAGLRATSGMVGGYCSPVRFQTRMSYGFSCRPGAAVPAPVAARTGGGRE